MKLWHLTFRQIRTRPGRATLTVLSIVIGVAAVVAVSEATSATRRAYKDMFRAVTGKADLEIRADDQSGVDPKYMSEIEKVPGVKAVVPMVQTPASIHYGEIPEGGEQKSIKLNLLAIDPARDQAVREYDVVEGKPLDDEDGVLLDAGVAHNLGIKVGEAVTIGAGHRTRERTVLGLVTPRGADAAKQGGMIFLRLSDFQHNFAWKPDIVDVLQVVLARDAKPEEAKGAIGALLPKELAVSIPQANTQQADQSMQSTERGLQLATALSLVVSVIIVLNTFLMNLTERRRQLSIMRAIGATRVQIIRLMLREGIIFGIVGTLLGLCVGWVGARWLSNAMSELMQAPRSDLVLSPVPIIWGVIFGIGISFVATLIPSWFAGRLTPLEGMCPVPPPDRDRIWGWLPVVAAILLVSGSTTLTGCILEVLSIELSIPAAMLILCGCVFLVPVVLNPLSRLAMLPLAPFLGIEAQLAHGQVLRRRVRTTLTVAVVFMAMVMDVGLGTSIVNSTQDVRDWFKRTVAGDFFIRTMMPNAGDPQVADVPEQVLDETKAIPGVKDVNRVKFVGAVIEHASGAATAADKKALTELKITMMAREMSPREPMSLDLREGDPDTIDNQLRAGEVVLSTVLAQKLNIKVGDTVYFKTSEGKKSVKVAGLINEYAFGGLTGYMEWTHAQQMLHFEGISAFAISVDSAHIDEIEPQLAAMCRRNGVLLQSYASFAKIVEGMMSGVVGTLWCLLALAFIAASFGIVNTLTMNVLEQTRELGMLRVVAMTRAQVKKTIFSQAVIMGLIGLVPGTVLGILVVYLMHLSSRASEGRVIPFILHPALMGVCFVVASCIVVGAAWLPARRAASLKLTDALHYE